MNVEDHAHCEMCSRTVAIGERFCGREECAAAYAEQQASKKKEVYKFVGLLAAVMVLVYVMNAF